VRDRGKTVRDDRKEGERGKRERQESGKRGERVRGVRKSNIIESWKRTFCFVVTVLLLIISYF